MMTGNKEFKIAYANAIVEKLWLKGLLTDEQKDRIMAKNSLLILS